MNLGLMFDAMVVLPSGVGLTLTLTVLSLTAGFLLSVPLRSTCPSSYCFYYIIFARKLNLYHNRYHNM